MKQTCFNLLLFSDTVNLLGICARAKAQLQSTLKVKFTLNNIKISKNAADSFLFSSNAREEDRSVYLVFLNFGSR